MGSQITGISIVCSSICSGTDRRKHQSYASLAFVRGIHRSHSQMASNAENVLIWWRHHDHFWHVNSLRPDWIVGLCKTGPRWDPFVMQPQHLCVQNFEEEFTKNLWDESYTPGSRPVATMTWTEVPGISASYRKTTCAFQHYPSIKTH